MQCDAAITAAGQPSVVIVLLNWNDAAPTLNCLDALRQLDYGNARILVVDNGSNAEAVQPLMVRQDIELVRNPTNLGFAGGANAGLRRAFASGADYVWLLNNDALPAPDALTKLVVQAEAEPAIGLLSPVIHNHGEASRPNACFGRFDRGALSTTHSDNPQQARQWLAEYPGDILAFGTALLIRSALFEAIGGLDENMFAYVEDVDYCLRCAKAGYRVGYCFEAIVWHSFRTDPFLCPPYVYYYMSRNYLLLWRKLGGRPLFLARVAYWYLAQHLVLIERIPAYPAGIEGILGGLWDGLLGRGGIRDSARRPPWWLRQTLGRYPRAFLWLVGKKSRA